MSVAQLSESEQVVLLALVGLVARADGIVSGSEMHTLEQLRTEIEPERFGRVRDAAAALDSPDAILEAAGKVTEPDARALIFDMLVSMALPDTLAENEVALLSRLATTWGLDDPFAG